MNPIGMGGTGPVSERDMREPRASFVEDPPQPTPQPIPELIEVDVPVAPAPAGLDLTKPEAAMAAGLEVAGPAVGAAVPAMPAAAPALPAAPVAPRIPERFNPRDWLLIQGHDLSAGKRLDMAPVRAPAVVVEGKQQPARPATIGNILRDGFGRKVRSASGGYVKTTRF